ncbi:Scr1 family TA system antitoxin-like transcriptional regulator [Amycolatopsis sp. WAC 04182]|uniref:Scr1 family TA system antitoxin-like transcriptional regulator n=1 Tax=Amycolatopsis sp. WAC 04182 TaxID=2203198 RepID=UPI000F79FB05|nr:Scr1 family TA system antitoxin-like transcriptional regulator [Amycolatopsis sp. WAC 04182]
MTTRDTLDRIRADAVALCRAEETAVSIRSYGGLEFPDLLMDGAYAEQMWSMRTAFQPLPAIAGALLQPRRMAVLRRDPPAEASFVVNESALTVLEYGRGDPRVATAQLRWLADRIDERACTVRVLHFGARLALTPDPAFGPVLGGTPGPAFTIVTDADGRETVFADAPTPSRIQIVRDEIPDVRGVAYYTRRFAELSDASLDRNGSRERIRDAIRRREELAALAPSDGDNSTGAVGTGGTRRSR